MCICLTADRPELTARAVECFERQTYEHKELLVYETGLPMFGRPKSDPRIAYYLDEDEPTETRVGVLRNRANTLACISTAISPPPDIFAHWDSDDWSHPYRLAEQVNHLLTSKADCVGYNDMLFWHNPPGHAYLYEYWPLTNNVALGTSLMYWRRAWEKHPFEPVREGEDRKFIKAVMCSGQTSIPSFLSAEQLAKLNRPRMIAHVHGANTVMTPDRFEQCVNDPTSKNFKRYYGLDGYCRQVMRCSPQQTESRRESVCR